MADTDNLLYVPEEHRVTATQLWLEMDMLDFEFICLKVRMMEEAKACNYQAYRDIQRKQLPASEAKFAAARDSLFNFLKECLPSINLAGGSGWDYLPDIYAVQETPRRAPGGLIHLGGSLN